MRVLYILHFPPPMHGSAMVGEYIRNSTIINNEVKAKYLNLSTSVSVDDIGKGGILKAFRYIKLLYNVLWYLLFWKPDLCYLTPSSYIVGMAKDSLVVALIRLFRVKHVYHFHNKGVAYYSKKAINRILYSFVFKKAKVILLSPYLYSDIIQYVPEERVRYCSNGIPPLNFQKHLILDNIISDNTFTILFLSNLMESKGINDLLSSCHNLKNQGVMFFCIIAGGEGDISSKELLERIKTLNLDENITYRGKVMGLEKIKLFADADIFVHPTCNDCFPLVLLEAMQMSLPVVSTYEGAIPEIVRHGETGLLVDRGDVNGLSDAMIQLIKSDSLRSSMGIAGKERFDRLYTLDKFEINFLNTLKIFIQRKYR